VRRKEHAPDDLPSVRTRHKGDLVEEREIEEQDLSPRQVRENPYKTPPNELTSKGRPR
jgi:hypothetical protein